MYKIFTIKSGEVEQGAVVEKFTISEDVTIPAILVGERGRGRSLAVLPVQLSPEQYSEWRETESVRIFHAGIGVTRSGRAKLIVNSTTDIDTGKIICVFYTKIGFRGSNYHTGDQIYQCKDCGLSESSLGHIDICPKCSSRSFQQTYDIFPGEILVKGIIAQGAAGRMGSGEQLVSVIPKDKVFRTAYSGRLYGADDEHFYLWNGETLISVTREQRVVSDIF